MINSSNELMDEIESLISRLEMPPKELLKLPFDADAKLNASLAFSAASLYYALLNMKDVDLEDHPIRDKLGEIKASLQECKKS